ncbi:MAG TPA: radical SAM protein [Parachlamydiaceae bacterium]|nr:radical SAM protein [Parachlamydiaceae bacterium]
MLKMWKEIQPLIEKVEPSGAPLSIKFVEVILKTVERCNLNCSYCYFFQGEDKSYKKHPPIISKSTIEQVAQFLLDGALDLNLEAIKIDFHGGEPMMQKIGDFDSMCNIFREKLSPHVLLDLAIQTNGTLITDEWIQVCGKHDVGIGVSCDGPQEYHDKFRVDYKGRGSHEIIAKNLKKLNDAHHKGIIRRLGLLSVINAEYDANTIYGHFTKELEIQSMNFLLPDFTHDSFDQSALAYGEFLCQLFDAWVEEDNPEINVKILKQTLQQLTGDSLLLRASDEVVSSYAELTIASNGALAPVDTLRSAHSDLMWSQASIQSTSLSNFLQYPLYQKIKESQQTLPLACQNCNWRNACRGGNLVNRYSKHNFFDNPSVLCEGLKQFYKHVVKYLYAQNFPHERLLEVLGLDSSMSKGNLIGG